MSFLNKTKHAPGHALLKGARLEHYRVHQALNAGGFGIVYLCHDEHSDQQVIIKEYMPNKLALRGDDGTIGPISDAHAENFGEGRKLFLQEATALTRLDHPNIVRVLNFFSANDTVYMVMEYRPGKNLQSYIRSHSGGLSETLLRTVFPPLLNGLRLVHNTGLLHLDIKPGNIHLCPGGIPLLLDFGAVFPRCTSRKLQVAQVVTPGFSPVEQYDPSGYVGPWTDIYAIGATLRTCIEGNSPPPSNQRKEKDKLRPAANVFRRRYSANLLEALDWAMEIDPLLRPQSVDEFIQALDRPDQEPGDLLEHMANPFSWFRG
ncbi:MAG TPA: serine/threonine protein kinase [Gammaproteobacteria bacterium]|nr:serine/threonine protein kinase [Gammaproteobacteria bacterium]